MTMQIAYENLVLSTHRLPDPIKRAMRLALASGWYTIGSHGWESKRGVCPIVAAAKLAGVWREGHCADGGPEWGDEEEPSAAAMAFAVSFDIYAEAAGTAEAVELVSAILEGLPLVLAA